jgi:hypothetical protein
VDGLQVHRVPVGVRAAREFAPAEITQDSQPDSSVRAAHSHQENTATRLTAREPLQ